MLREWGAVLGRGRGRGRGRGCGVRVRAAGRRRGGGAPRLLARGLWVSAEFVVTLGVVLLLLVAHQLWWTNREARAEAGRTVQDLRREWDEPAAAVDDGVREGSPPSVGLRPGGRGRAGRPGGVRRSCPSPVRPPLGPGVRRAAHPRIGLTAPVAEGTSKGGVLDRGYVGHYARTAQAGQAGNFALAGHRNTHGEPFRRIDRLRSGDRITVETRDAVYTYTVGKRLAQTAPSDSGVIAPVPRSNITTSAGYSEPGYYLTLTTCTPEFSSRYRLVVWGSSPRCARGDGYPGRPGVGSPGVRSDQTTPAVAVAARPLCPVSRCAAVREPGHPLVFGVPFLFVWLLGATLLTPVAVWLTRRGDRR